MAEKKSVEVSSKKKKIRNTLHVRYIKKKLQPGVMP